MIGIADRDRNKCLRRIGVGTTVLGVGLVPPVSTAGAQGPPEQPPGQSPAETVTVTKTIREPAPPREQRTRTVTVPGPTETVYSEGETTTKTVTSPGRTREVEVAKTQTGDVIRAVLAGIAVLILGFGLWWAFERWRHGRKAGGEP